MALRSTDLNLSCVTLGRLAAGLEPPSSRWKPGFYFLNKHATSGVSILSAHLGTLAGSFEGRSPAFGDATLSSGLWPEWCTWVGGGNFGASGDALALMESLDSPSAGERKNSSMVRITPPLAECSSFAGCDLGQRHEPH